MKIEVPAYTNGLDNFQKLTVVMHAGGIGGAAYWHQCPGCRNNMLMMTGNTCTIQNIPANIFPVDVAIGLTEINSTLDTADWEDRHFALTTATLSEAILNLHPDIQQLCQGKKYEGAAIRKITKEAAELFRIGESSFSVQEISQSCRIQVKLNFCITIQVASSRLSHLELRTRSPGCGQMTKPQAPGARKR